jgi:hypothetical protein
MKILKIEVDKNNHIRADWDNGDSSREGEIQLDPLRKTMLDILEGWFRDGRIRERKEIELLGEILFQAIFQNNVDLFFREKLNSLPKGERMRIELVFQPGTEDLSGRMWEFMYSEKDGFFAVNHNLFISRWIPSDRDRVVPPPVKELKILLVVSLPEEALRELKEAIEKGDFGKISKKYLGQLSEEDLQGLQEKLNDPITYDKIMNEIEDYKKIAKYIDELSINPSITVRRIDNPNGDSLMEEMEEYEPHIVHFIGCGDYGRIILHHGIAGQTWCCSSFADLFSKFQPRLVFLQLCMWPPETMQANFATLGPELMRKEIPNIIASQYPINPDTAKRLTKTFYEGLAAGKTIDTAFIDGRLTISRGLPTSILVAGSPVVYMHSRQEDKIYEPEQARTGETSGLQQDISTK